MTCQSFFLFSCHTVFRHRAEKLGRSNFFHKKKKINQLINQTLSESILKTSHHVAKARKQHTDLSNISLIPAPLFRWLNHGHCTGLSHIMQPMKKLQRGRDSGHVSSIKNKHHQLKRNVFVLGVCILTLVYAAVIRAVSPSSCRSRRHTSRNFA